MLWKSSIAVVVSDADDGLMRNVNDAFCQLLGYRREELIGRRSTDVGLWADPAERERVVSSAREGSWLAPVEIQVRTASGEIRTVLYTVVQVNVDDELVLAAQLYDITERRKTEERLRVLNHVARLGYEEISAQAILNGTLRALHNLFPEVRVSYGTIDPGGIIRFEASAGSPEMPPLVGTEVDLSSARDYVAEIMSGNPITIPDVSLDPRVAPLTQTFINGWTVAMLDVPVCRGGQTVGVLSLDANKPRAWSSHELTTTQEVAALLAVSLFRAQAEEELRNERELLQTLMDYLPDFLYIKDVNSRFTRANRSVAEFLGHSNPEDCIGTTDFDYFPEPLARRYFEDEQRVIATGEAMINRLEPQDELETIWALTTTVPVKDANGTVIGIVGTVRDISERQAMEAALRASEARERALLEAIPDVFFQFNRDGVYLDMRMNRGWQFWVDPQTRLGRRLDEVHPAPVAMSIVDAIRAALDHDKVATVEYEVEQTEQLLTFEMRIVPTGPDEVVAISRDVTERKLLEQRLAHQATHDPLTGLPNRALFDARLDEALDRARQEQALLGVLFIDLDNFKEVNDRLGHAAGDRVLTAVADRLRLSIRGGDTVARIGGDEFAVLLEGISHRSEAELVARRTVERIGRPVRIGVTPAQTTASIGVAVGMPDGPVNLLDAADLAMYDAKRQGKGRHVVTWIVGETAPANVTPMFESRQPTDAREDSARSRLHDGQAADRARVLPTTPGARRARPRRRSAG
jgi:diguanylate cyclase (GGDEF)-like protein/PAS domain S-box-containing protein